MSSLLDYCAELERENAGREVKIRPMTPMERKTAAGWMNVKIQRRSGNSAVRFPEEWLPATGLSARTADGGLLAVATLYLEQSTPVAVCGFCVANPLNAARESKRAVRALLAAMPDYAREHGAGWLLTTFGNRGINRILEEFGFTAGETSETKFKRLR